MKQFWITILCLLTCWTISCDGISAQSQTDGQKVTNGHDISEDKKILAENKVVDACQLMEDKEHDKAITLLNEARELDPENDAVYFYLSQIYALKGDSELTETYLNKAIGLDPKNFWYRYTSCILYNSLKETDKSIASYEDLIEDFPKNTNLYYDLFNLYTSKKEYDKALKILEQADEITGKTEQTALLRYQLLCMLGREDEAIKVLEAYNEEFSSPDILCQMADHAKRTYKDSLAMAYYDEALTLDSEYPRAILGKGEIYLFRRQIKEFLSSVKKTVRNPMTPPQVMGFYTNFLSDFSNRSIHEAYPAETDSLISDIYDVHKADSNFTYPIARYYFITGRPDRSKEVFQKTCDVYPDDIRPYYNYVNYFLAVKDWEGLIAELNGNGKEKYPEDLQLGEILNYAYYQQEDYRGIIENCTRIMEAHRGQKEIELNMLGQIGDMYYQLEDKKQAYRMYEKALKIDENYIPVLNNYAYFLSLDGKKLNKAYKMSKKTVDAEPNNPTYLDTLGWILYLQGKYEEAKTYFKQAMLHGGKENVTNMEHYATVLEALGENDLAAFYRTRIENMKKQEK